MAIGRAAQSIGRESEGISDDLYNKLSAGAKDVGTDVESSGEKLGTIVEEEGEEVAEDDSAVIEGDASGAEVAEAIGGTAELGAEAAAA